MKMWKQTTLRILGIAFVLSLFVAPGVVLTAYAQPTHSSPNYGVDEVFFGSGGVNDANSANYNARASLGDLGVGNSVSASFMAYGGFTTTDEPFIEVTVNAQSVDLGIQDTATTSTGTATFKVRTWLADGYTVTNSGASPTYSTHSIASITDALGAAPSPGTEQFGINLVANTTPTNVGADPVQLPDNTFSTGNASTGYDADGLYKYVAGDIVAESSQSTSITEYTVTYMMNVAGSTPAGTYVMNHNLVVTSQY